MTTSAITARHRLHGTKSVFKDIIREFKKLRDHYAQTRRDHLTNEASIRLPTRDRSELEVSQSSYIRIGAAEDEPANVIRTDPSHAISNPVTKTGKTAA